MRNQALKMKKIQNFQKKKILNGIFDKTIGGPISFIADIGYSEQLLNCRLYRKIVLGWTRGHLKA